MTTPDPLDRSVRNALQDVIENHAHGGDFEATWQAALDRSARPRLPLAGLAVAAAAVLALSVPLWRTITDHGPAGFRALPAAWQEPERLRFEVDPPTPDATVPVRAAHAEADPWNRAKHWEVAFRDTPEAERPELASRRALVEQARGDLDGAKEAGLGASGPGRLVAAEVHLIDLERPKAIPILRDLRSDTRVGSAATAYLTLLDRGGVSADLGEVVALSHTGGAGRAACEAAEALLRLASEDVRAEAIALGPALGRCEGPQAEAPAPAQRGAVVELHTSGRGKVLVCLDRSVTFDGPTRFEVQRLPAHCLIQIDGAKAILEVSASGNVTCDKQGDVVVCDPTALTDGTPR